MKRMVASKALGIITVLLLALINVVAVTGVGLALNTGTVHASPFLFNTTTAVDYAELWWNGRNPDYHDYGNVDCANFVSQSLIAGGLNLRQSPYVDSWGCIPSCDNLHTYLVNYLGVRYETRSRTEPAPSWFLPGDVAIFGDSRDPWQHSVFAVATESISNTIYTLCDAHSNNRHQVTIRFYFDGSPTWSLCNYYNVSEEATLIPTTMYLSDAVAVKGKPVNAEAMTSTGINNPLPGVTIKVLTQQRVKNVLKWINIGSAVSGPDGKAIVSIPSKSITMDQQPIRAIFVGDDSYGGSADTALVNRQ